MEAIQQHQIFEEWIKDHKALLFKVIRSYALEEEDRNDLFQEICLQLFRSIPNFRKKSSTSTWIYRICLNTAIKWSLKEKSQQQRQAEVKEISHLLTIKEEPDERLSWLYDTIRSFHEIDKSMILLFLDGYSYREISNLTGISESNVGVKIHRIKKQLAALAKEYEYGI
ncbi:MAG: RNA polymerase sigma factor [Bacteroidota bacterium]